MDALVMTQYGPPQVLQLTQVSKPTLAKPTELLIKVHACGVNVGEAIVRSGRVKALFGVKFPFTPGFDFSGQVVEAGSQSSFKIGQLVFGHKKMPRAGAQAQFVVVDEKLDIVGEKPEGVTHVEAAAMPVAGLTAYGALVNSGKINQPMNEKKTVLVVGASGAVGSFATLIASQIFNASVFGICSGKNASYVQQLGAEKVIDYKTENVSEALKALGIKFDIIVDTIGAEYYQVIKPYVAKNGSICAVSGPVNVAQGASMGILGVPGMIGTVAFRSIFGQYKLVQQAMNDEFHVMNEWLKDGKLDLKKIKIETMKLGDGAKAHEALDSSRVVGKLVLLPW